MIFDIDKYKSISVNKGKDSWGSRVISSSSDHKSIRDEAGNVVTVRDESQDVQINAATVRARKEQ